jgi:SAM-dependent methyltransferase
MANLVNDYWRFRRHKESYRGASGYLEIKPDWREHLPQSAGQSGEFLRRILGDAKSVLDVGAGDRLYARVFQQLGISAKYHSADPDDSFTHDYGDFLDITDRFDAITMFELIEHLDVGAGLRFMEHAHSLLTDGGTLLISTPNPHHPNQVWRSEVMHVRPWPSPDLYGALRLSGFGRVEIHRQHLVATGRRKLLLPVHKAMYRLMDLDHAQGIFAAAWKQSPVA